MDERTPRSGRYKPTRRAGGLRRRPPAGSDAEAEEDRPARRNFFDDDLPASSTSTATLAPTDLLSQSTLSSSSASRLGEPGAIQSRPTETFTRRVSSDFNCNPKPRALTSRPGSNISSRSQSPKPPIPVTLSNSSHSLGIAVPSSLATSTTPQAPVAKGIPIIQRVSASPARGRERDASPGLDFSRKGGLDVAGSPRTPRAGGLGGTANLARLEAEVADLKRQLQATKTPQKHGVAHDAATERNIDRTIRHMLLGKPYNLSQFRSLSDKMTLLDKAIRLSDGDIIIKVVLFIKQTLSWKLFCRYIINNKVAVDHYCSYLRQAKDWDNLIEMLNLLNRSDEATYIKYAQTLEAKENRANVGFLISSLNQTLAHHFNTDTTLRADADIVAQQISLLSTQKKINERDQKFIKTDSVKFREFGLYGRTVIGMTVVETIFYLAIYHYQSEVLRPHTVARDVALSTQSAQYQFPLVQGLALAPNWAAVDQELRERVEGTSKSAAATDNTGVAQIQAGMMAAWKKAEAWKSTAFKGDRGNMQISPLLAVMLFRNSKKHRDEFCRKISDIDERSTMAKLFCPDIYIDCLVTKQDWVNLEKEKAKLDPNKQSDALLLRHIAQATAPQKR